MSARRRIASFGGVGAAVAGLSFVILAALVDGLGWSPHWAYAAQAVICLQLNFTLNRRLTWPDRAAPGSLRRQWLRFHASRAVTVPGNQALFSALTLAGSPYWAANGACLALVAASNFLLAHLWIFGRTAP